jgi:hypothetical protein
VNLLKIPAALQFAALDGIYLQRLIYRLLQNSPRNRAYDEKSASIFFRECGALRFNKREIKYYLN